MKLPRNAIAIICACCSFVLVGAEGGCGEEPTIPITGNCSDLSNDECFASTQCELVQAPTPANADRAARPEDPYCACVGWCDESGSCYEECPDCPPPAPVDLICVPKRSECGDLNELQCIAHPDCEPQYATTSCLQAPEADPAPPCPQDDFDCFRPCDRATAFVGCAEQSPTQCGPVCDIYCEYGNVIDDNGCATCACNPPPIGCEGLSELECIADPACWAEYEVVDRCAGGMAPPCDPSVEGCEDGFARPCLIEETFVGCHQ